MAALIRIYCPWNNRIDEKRFDLGCPGSLGDLNRHASELKEGMRVMFYEPDELEAEGTLEFDSRDGRWIAVPDFSTIRYIGRSAAYGKKPNQSVQPMPGSVTPRAVEREAE